MAIKHCPKCSLDLPREQFSKNSSRRDGLQGYCKRCSGNAKKSSVTKKPEQYAEAAARYKRAHRDRINAATRERRKRNPEKARAGDLRDRQAHPERARARWAVGDAIRAGKLVRPTRCSRCDHEGSVEGHHPDYSRPLCVVWVCRKCHLEIHNEAN